MEEETWLRNEMDGRIRVLLNQKNLRRIDQICEMGKHGERTPPQSLGIQRLHANEESVRESKTSNENVHLFSYSTEQFWTLVTEKMRLWERCPDSSKVSF